VLWFYFHGLPYKTELRTELPVNSTKLIAPTILVIICRHEPHKKHRYSIVAFVSVDAGTCLQSCCTEMAPARTTEDAVLLLLHGCMLRALPSNGRCLHSHCLAKGLICMHLVVCHPPSLPSLETTITAMLRFTMYVPTSTCNPEHRSNHMTQEIN
jgi:hypothetical protein